MKFSIVTLALAAAATAQQYGGQYGQSGNQPSQQYGQQPNYGQQQQYQQPQQYQQYNAPNKYSPAEAQAWHGCVDGFLDQLNLGHEGSKTACSFWTCLEQTAGKYNRGGALAAVGQGVNLVCKASGIIPVSIT